MTSVVYTGRAPSASVRLLVCGGRRFTNRQELEMHLDIFAQQRTIECVIEGEARGADTMAREWAESRGIAVLPFKVDPKIDGAWPGAGPRRNQRMLDDGKPTFVIAFDGAKGTADMLSRARKVRIPFMHVLTAQ